MTIRYKTQAFVFKKEDRNEADRVFSVFTEDFGRIEVFAKAIRKNASKLRGGIDTFFMSEIEFIQGKNRKTLTDTLAIEKYHFISKDLEKFKTARRIGEAINNLVKGEEKDKSVFNLLNEVFDRLNDRDLKSARHEAIYYYFLWNVLSLLGYRPEVQMCNACHEKLSQYEIYFSENLGGVICKECLECDPFAEKINSDVVKMLRLIFKKEWQVLSRLKIELSSQDLFRKISDGYYKHTLSNHSFIY